MEDYLFHLAYEIWKCHESNRKTCQLYVHGTANIQMFSTKIVVSTNCNDIAKPIFFHLIWHFFLSRFRFQWERHEKKIAVTAEKGICKCASIFDYAQMHMSFSEENRNRHTTVTFESGIKIVNTQHQLNGKTKVQWENDTEKQQNSLVFCRLCNVQRDRKWLGAKKKCRW